MIKQIGRRFSKSFKSETSKFSVEQAMITIPINREANRKSKTQDFIEKQEQLRNRLGYTCELKRAHIKHAKIILCARAWKLS